MNDNIQDRIQLNDKEDTKEECLDFEEEHAEDFSNERLLDQECA